MLILGYWKFRGFQVKKFANANSICSFILHFFVVLIIVKQTSLNILTYKTISVDSGLLRSSRSSIRYEKIIFGNWIIMFSIFCQGQRTSNNDSINGS